MIPINLLEDGAFKSLCSSIEARKTISLVVSIITGVDYNLIYYSKFIGGELPKQNSKEKRKESDLIIDVSDELKIIIEMNQYPSKNIFKKNSDYAFNILTRSTRKNGKYIKVIIINIDNFNYFMTKLPIVDVDIQSKKYVIENNSYKSYHVILENIVNKEYNKSVNNKVIKFFEFLMIKNLEEMKKKYKGDEEYMKMIEKVEDIYNDDNYIGYYYVEDRHKMELEDMRLTGIDEGMEIGEARGLKMGEARGLKMGETRGLKMGETRGLKIGEETGRMAEKGEIAQKLLSVGMPESEVYKIVGLPISKNRKLEKDK